MISFLANIFSFLFSFSPTTPVNENGRQNPILAPARAYEEELNINQEEIHPRRRSFRRQRPESQFLSSSVEPPPKQQKQAEHSPQWILRAQDEEYDDDTTNNQSSTVSDGHLIQLVPKLPSAPQATSAPMLPVVQNPATTMAMPGCLVFEGNMYLLPHDVTTCRHMANQCTRLWAFDSNNTNTMMNTQQGHIAQQPIPPPLVPPLSLVPTTSSNTQACQAIIESIVNKYPPLSTTQLQDLAGIFTNLHRAHTDILQLKGATKPPTIAAFTTVVIKLLSNARGANDKKVPLLLQRFAHGFNHNSNTRCIQATSRHIEYYLFNILPLLNLTFSGPSMQEFVTPGLESNHNRRGKRCGLMKLCMLLPKLSALYAPSESTIVNAGHCHSSVVAFVNMLDQEMELNPMLFREYREPVVIEARTTISADEVLEIAKFTASLK